MERNVESRPVEGRPSQLEAAGRPALAAPYLNLDVVIERARRERNEEVARLVRRFFAWIEAGFESARRRDVDRLLSRSTDLADLERRMRDMERGNDRWWAEIGH